MEIVEQYHQLLPEDNLIIDPRLSTNVATIGIAITEETRHSTHLSDGA